MHNLLLLVCRWQHNARILTFFVHDRVVSMTTVGGFDGRSFKATFCCSFPNLTRRMSFRPRPFDQPTRKEAKHSVDEELLVFGYSCKLYRNDRNAEMEDSGALLIPWMGDSSLMIDR